MQPQIAGINWYRREDYPRILEVMEDRHLLAPTYDEWLRAAEKGIQHFTDKGLIAIKAEIEPESFLAWCKERGLKVDAKARNEWGNSVALAEARRRGMLPK